MPAAHAPATPPSSMIRVAGGSFLMGSDRFYPEEGLYDMADNVWEWTSGFFSPRHMPVRAKPCCTLDKAHAAGASSEHTDGAAPLRSAHGRSHV